ncbi:MAG TPA: LamG-like jellyroll fold domain-containing protein [Kofleriaceae bacterium]
MVKLALVMLGACGFTPGVGTDATSPDTKAIDASPHYRKKITLAVGSPTALTDFPISIVTSDPDLAAHALADGSDLGMTLVDGTPLSREIVAFDKPSGALEAWVRLPTVTDTLDIYMTYGAMPSLQAASVWSPDVFSAAWHLAETGAGSWVDTANGHVVTPASNTTTAASTSMGIVGAARLFDGVDDTSPGPNAPDLTFGMTSFSVQVWVNVAQSADGYDMVIDKGGDTNMPGYCLTLGTANWLVEVGDNGYVVAPFGFEIDMLGHWNQLTAVIDRTQNVVKAYANGVLTGSTSLGTIGSMASTHTFAIGSTNLSERFEGVVDEVRVFKVPLTTEWIAAEYRNSMMRSAFVVFGSEETM